MIFHYSHQPLRKEIEGSGFLGLEGCRLEYFIEEGLHLNRPRSGELSLQWRLMKKEMKARGRYVWFTEQQFAKSIGSMEVPKVKYSFDSRAIRAFSWPSLMDIAKNDKKRFKAMTEVSTFGLNAGDDPMKWWVTFEEVPFSKCDKIEEIGLFESASMMSN